MPDRKLEKDNTSIYWLEYDIEKANRSLNELKYKYKKEAIKAAEVYTAQIYDAISKLSDLGFNVVFDTLQENLDRNSFTIKRRELVNVSVNYVDKFGKVWGESYHEF